MRHLTLCVFTTMHPIEDVRVHKKVVRSFLDRGWKVKWIGPDTAIFPPANDDPVAYDLTAPPKSRLDRFVKMPALMKKLAISKDISVIYCPEPDSALLALPIAKLRRIPVIFDIHENYHDGALARWVPPKLLSALSLLTRRTITLTAGLAEESMAVNDVIAGHYASKATQPRVVRNLAPRSFARNAPREARQAKAFVAYHGKAIPQNGTPTLIRAWGELKNRPEIKLAVLMQRHPDGRPQFLEIDAEIERLGIRDSIIELDAVNHDQMPGVLDSMDVGLISYQRDLGIDSLPNRFFEFMARGLPVISPEYSVHLREITVESGCGISVDMEDPAAIAAAVTAFADDRDKAYAMGESGRRAFLSDFSWDADFEPLFKSVCALVKLRQSR